MVYGHHQPVLLRAVGFTAFLVRGYAMKKKEGTKQSLHVEFLDNFEVISVDLIEFTAIQKEGDEEFEWLENQSERRNIFKAKTTVLIGLSGLLISLVSVWK